MAPPLPFSSTEAALLPGLLLLETVLSADNALVLASLVQPLETEAERERLLSWGLALALLLRVLVAGTAGVVVLRGVTVNAGFLTVLAVGLGLLAVQPISRGGNPRGADRPGGAC